MRVTDRVKNGVVYLAGRRVHGDANTEVNEGSGVIMSAEFRGILFLYVATAHHVVKALEKYQEVVVRFNDSDGNGHVVPLLAHLLTDSSSKWVRHPDHTVDLAVIQLSIAHLHGQLKGVTHAPLSNIIREDQFGADGIGIGDEVFIAGLFHYVPGKDSNSPIIRVGNLAMLPDFLVNLEDYGQAEVYLIEARSIGGLSGSPVWVRETIRLSQEESPEQTRFVSGNFYLLGLIHGIWYIDPKDLHATSIPGTVTKADLGLNVGISVVVPAKKIREVIEGPEFTKIRTYLAAIHNASEKLPTPTPTSNVPFDPAVAALFQVPKSAIDKLQPTKPKRPRKKS